MNKVVAFDYDGVIRNIDTLMTDVLIGYIEKYELGLTIDKEAYDTCNLDIKKLCGMTEEQETAFWSSDETHDFYETVHERIDIHDIIELVKENGFKTALVTARGNNGPTEVALNKKDGKSTYQRTVELLNDSGIHFDMYLFNCEDKAKVLNDINAIAIYEDMFHNIESIEKNSDTHVFMMNTIFNQLVEESEQVQRISTFSDSIEKLKELMAENISLQNLITVSNANVKITTGRGVGVAIVGGCGAGSDFKKVMQVLNEHDYGVVVRLEDEKNRIEDFKEDLIKNIDNDKIIKEFKATETKSYTTSPKDYGIGRKKYGSKLSRKKRTW